VLLNVTQFSVANLSQIANMPLIALADGAIKIKSLAYASTAANQVPMKQSIEQLSLIQSGAHRGKHKTI